MNNNRYSEPLKRIRSAWVLYGVLLVSILVILLIIYFVIRPGDAGDDLVEELSRLPEWRPTPWPSMPSPAEIAGCYSISFEKWFPDRDPRRTATSLLAVPLRIELTTGRVLGVVLGEGAEVAFIMRPAPGVEPSIHEYASWHITSQRTILLRWSTGTSSLSVEMGPSGGGGLWGFARTWLDYPGNAQITRVSAKRIECPDKREK